MDQTQVSDLPVYPDSYLSSPIVKKQLLDNDWTICVLEDGTFIYFDQVGYFFPITREHFKWNLINRARMENLGAKDIAGYADTEKQEEYRLIDQVLQFITEHSPQAD